MIYKQTGKIQEKISALGVGCWNMGGDWDTSNQKNAKEIIHAAIDMGVNFFDVAPVYGWGTSEEVLGNALKQNGSRHKVLIASKCGLVWEKPQVTENNLSKQSMLKEIDATLKRLQTDYVDIYQLHWPDSATPLEETAEALEIMKKAGKIRYVGMSNYGQNEVEKMMQYISVDCQQGLYNMLERNAASYHNIPLDYRTEKEVFPNVKKYGQAFLPYSPLMQGLLAGKFADDFSVSEKDVRISNPKLTGKDFPVYQKGAAKLRAFGEEIGHPINEVVLNWMRQKEEITSVINGVSNVQQLESNLHCITWELTQDEIDSINNILAIFETME